jgi:hypothetical protein
MDATVTAVPGRQELGPKDAVQVTVIKGNVFDAGGEVVVNAWNRNVVPWWLLVPGGCQPS